MIGSIILMVFFAKSSRIINIWKKMGKNITQINQKNHNIMNVN